MPDGVLDPAGLLGTLSAHGVDFVVIGAMAVGVHAEVRGTGDVDVMVPIGDEANKRALQGALEQLDAVLLSSENQRSARPCRRQERPRPHEARRRSHR